MIAMASRTNLQSAPSAVDSGAERAPSGVCVTVRSLFKSYGAKSVLRNLDLHVAAGQMRVDLQRLGLGRIEAKYLRLRVIHPDDGVIMISHGSSFACSRRLACAAAAVRAYRD